MASATFDMTSNGLTTRLVREIGGAQGEQLRVPNGTGSGLSPAIDVGDERMTVTSTLSGARMQPVLSAAASAGAVTLDVTNANDVDADVNAGISYVMSTISPGESFTVIDRTSTSLTLASPLAQPIPNNTALHFSGDDVNVDILNVTRSLGISHPQRTPITKVYAVDEFKTVSDANAPYVAGVEVDFGSGFVSLLGSHVDSAKRGATIFYAVLPLPAGAFVRHRVLVPKSTYAPPAIGDVSIRRLAEATGAPTTGNPSTFYTDGTMALTGGRYVATYNDATAAAGVAVNAGRIEIVTAGTFRFYFTTDPA